MSERKPPKRDELKRYTQSVLSEFLAKPNGQNKRAIFDAIEAYQDVWMNGPKPRPEPQEPEPGEPQPEDPEPVTAEVATLPGRRRSAAAA